MAAPIDSQRPQRGDAAATPPPLFAGHPVRVDALGHLLPWTSWRAALDLEMNFYQQCPTDHGYPRFAVVTFLDGDWNPHADREDTIPATQDGMGIISYLKYYELLGGRDDRYLKTACALGDYLVRETLTPNSGSYPAFTRSTGKRSGFPLPPDAGSQGDRPFEIEPDKGGITGHALMYLHRVSGRDEYLAQALHNARVLAAHQQDGDATHSPWPFRVDYRNGEPRGPVSGNMTYVLRLYDDLLAQGYAEFGGPREALWRWIKSHQIPSAATDGALFAQFFEDHETPTNRAAWSPLNLARYLLERREQLDPDWAEDCAALVAFVRKAFTHQELGTTVCHEQDEDPEAWGGINSTFGAVLALYAKAVGSGELSREARSALNFTLYSIDERGRPRDLGKSANVGGWQEDAHTDVIHNYVDALRAFPAWGEHV
jgi:hypothetical protein